MLHVGVCRIIGMKFVFKELQTLKLRTMVLLIRSIIGNVDKKIKEEVTDWTAEDIDRIPLQLYKEVSIVIIDDD